MKKLTILALFVCMLLSVAVTAAYAGPPVHDRYQIVVDEVDPALSAECGFEVRVAGTIDIMETVFFDADDNPERIDVHVQYDGTLTNLASGLTLRDPGAYRLRFDLDDGTITESGMHFAITVPGQGVVVLDVGRLVAVNGELIFEAGPHQQLNQGNSLVCDALS